MSTDLDALIARLQNPRNVARLGLGGTCEEAAAALTDLRRQVTEKDAVIARQHELLFSFHAATNPEEHADICARIGDEADWCEARVKNLEAKLAAAEQRLRHVQAETWEQAAKMCEDGGTSGDHDGNVDPEPFRRRAQAAREGT